MREENWSKTYFESSNLYPSFELWKAHWDFFLFVFSVLLTHCWSTLLFIISGEPRRTGLDNDDWPSMWVSSSQVFTDNASSLSVFMIRWLAHGDSNNAQKFDCVNAIGVRSGTAKTHGNHHTGISDGFKVNQTEKTLSPLNMSLQWSEAILCG